MMLFQPAGERLVRETIARAMNAQDQAARDAVVARRALYGGQATAILQTRLDALFTDTEERLAVRRMLPQTKLGKHMLSKLKVYAGPDHRHQAQEPKPLVL